MIPSDVDQTAPVLVKRDRLIDVPPHVVWSLHSNVDRWTRWNSNILTASLDGPFAPGSCFQWKTRHPSSSMVSTIYSVEDERSTLWGSVQNGFTRIQRWEFVRTNGGVVVTTEESWSGAPFIADHGPTPRWRYPDPTGSRLELQDSLSGWLNLMASATHNMHRGGE